MSTITVPYDMTKTWLMGLQGAVKVDKRIRAKSEKVHCADVFYRAYNRATQMTLGIDEKKNVCPAMLSSLDDRFLVDRSHAKWDAIKS